jgi:hypothetical protein
MGDGRWDPNVYASTSSARIADGTAFNYSSNIRSGHAAAAVNAVLNPKTVAGPTSILAGTLVREARDNPDNPNSVPVLIAFDETGSMMEVPIELVKKLKELFELVVLKGYLSDPQFSFGAYGDAAIGEVAPLQIGQFEADNRADESLDALYLEGNGGGNRGETSALVWYYGARHTASDAWDKRGKKGYLFTIGDEVTFGVTREMIERYIGPDHGLQADLTVEEVYALASERWEVFHLVIDNYTATSQNSVAFYTQVMGDHCIALQDPATVSEIIASIIGVTEGAVDLDEALDNLDDVGASDTKAGVSKSLSVYGSGRVGGGAVAVAESPSDLDTRDDSVDRL